MFEETLLNVVFSLLPSPCIAAMAATAINAAISPYSIAVAARVSRSRPNSFLKVDPFTKNRRAWRSRRHLS